MVRFYKSIALAGAIALVASPVLADDILAPLTAPLAPLFTPSAPFDIDPFHILTPAPAPAPAAAPAPVVKKHHHGKKHHAKKKA